MKVTKASPSKLDLIPTQNEVTKLVQVPTPTEPAKEVMLSKSNVLKRQKKMAHRPHHSPERSIVKDGSAKTIFSPKGVSRKK